jgi:phenylalanine-4-hydroxylase
LTTWRTAAFRPGQFIRKPHQLDYLEEPDVFHDVFGHVPMLMNPAMADFIQAYGEGGLRAQRLGVLPQLARVYWYTVEFGLVQQADGCASTARASRRRPPKAASAWTTPRPTAWRFDLERVMRTHYRIDDFQESYFVLDNLDDLLELARIDFAPLYGQRWLRVPVWPLTLPKQVPGWPCWHNMRRPCSKPWRVGPPTGRPARCACPSICCNPRPCSTPANRCCSIGAALT